ncbi:MAG: ATP-dependent nuclease subunit B, partial [Clostridiales bacterium]|nr:ATP-dependent nuclease subunit B [Clostridiales bacterium]
DQALLAQMNALRRRAVAPLEALRLNQDKTGRGQALSLYTFLEDIGLPDRLEARTAALRERGALTLAAEYEQLWDILCRGLEQCASILGETPVALEEFAQILRLVLSQYTVGAIPVSLDRVTVGEAPRVANKGAKVLFFLGADDGSIPQAVSAPGLLSDEDCALLAACGLEAAPRLEEKLFREATVVYTACAQPTERLIVTWPGAGTEGEEKRPSFLVERLKRYVPSLVPQEEGALRGTFRLAAPRPALEVAGRDRRILAALKALPDWSERAARLERVTAWERGALSPGAVEALYGRRIPMSASRMDKYKSCHFSYFMQYGLRAQPRTPAGFDAPEYGTFVHYVLEHVFQESKTPSRAMVEAAVGRYVTEELGGMEDKTPRFRYLFGRLLRAVYQVVENVAEELSASAFTPIAFELGFGRTGELPPVELTMDGVTISISGLVDRVDGWEKDGRLYLRVVDYKTGRKSFDLTELWNGIGLQMLLYLFTLEREGETLYGKEVVPAGVLYLPARDVVVSGASDMDEEERRRLVDSALRRRGLLLDDPEVLRAMECPGEEGIRFLPVRLSARTGAITGEALVSAERLGRLDRHITGVLSEICRELASGNIAADPFWRGPQKNACLYCDYAEACQFEEGRRGDRRRYLPTVRGEAFWASIEGCAGEPSET